MPTDFKEPKASKDKRRNLRCVDCGQVRTITYSLSTSLLPKRCRPCGLEYRRQQLLSGKWLTCPNCGEQFYRRDSYIKDRKPGRTLFCSTKCLREGGGYRELAREQSQQRRGRGNPAYIHGRRVGENVPGWNLDEKGEYSCRNCGSAEAVELHHAIPRSHCRATKADLRNGIPLCRKCHRGWHSRRVIVYRDVFTDEEWSFLLAVDLIDRDTSVWLELNYPARPAA